MVALSQVPAVIFALVIAGMLLGAGALALSQFSTSLTAGSSERMAVGNTSLGLNNLAQQLPVVGTIIGVAIIIFVVVSAFGGGLGRRQ